MSNLDLGTLSTFTPEFNELLNKVILVSGAEEGLGRAAALAYASYGATVILLGANMSRLESVYDEIESKNYPKPAIFPMNFESTTEHDIQAMKESIENEFGFLSGILHNTAELGPRVPLRNYPVEQWNRVLFVNLTAPFLLTKNLMPLLEKHQHASVVFTGGAQGLEGEAYWGAYGVSKAAIDNFVQTFSQELDGTSTVRVNTIYPGDVRTRFRAAAYPAENPETVVAPEDVMDGYVFLMSPQSKNLNGKRLFLSEKN